MADPLWLPGVELGLRLWAGRYEDHENTWLRWTDVTGTPIATARSVPSGSVCARTRNASVRSSSTSVPSRNASVRTRNASVPNDWPNSYAAWEPSRTG